jgi:hypothetical protein
VLLCRHRAVSSLRGTLSGVILAMRFVAACLLAVLLASLPSGALQAGGLRAVWDLMIDGAAGANDFGEDVGA